MVPCRDEGRFMRVAQKYLPRAHDVVGKQLDAAFLV